MIFRDVHTNADIYIFDRSTLTLQQGKVTSVTPSHIDTRAPMAKMVVDVTIQIEGKPQTYTIEDTQQTAYFGNSAITCDHESILREIEALKTASEQVIKDIERHRKVVDTCTKLLTDNNPVLKERQETEHRFNAMEGKIDRLTALMERYVSGPSSGSTFSE